MEERELLSVEFTIESVERETIRRCHDAASERRSPVKRVGAPADEERARDNGEPIESDEETGGGSERSGDKSKYGTAIEVTIGPRKIIE